MLHQRHHRLPKGVVYSHRSSYLHSMAVCTVNALAVSERDRIMPIVPQFHANALACRTPR